MKRSIRPFGDNKVTLRLIEEQDLATTLAWRNRDAARVWFKSSEPILMDQHRSWYWRYLEKDDDFLFVVMANGSLVGQVSVYGIDWDRKTAEIGRFLAAPEAAGRGNIRASCFNLLEFCANALELSYVFLEVISTNERALRLYLNCGFVEEQNNNGIIRMGLRLPNWG